MAACERVHRLSCHPWKTDKNILTVLMGRLAIRVVLQAEKRRGHSMKRVKKLLSGGLLSFGSDRAYFPSGSVAVRLLLHTKIQAEGPTEWVCWLGLVSRLLECLPFEDCTLPPRHHSLLPGCLLEILPKRHCRRFAPLSRSTMSKGSSNNILRSCNTRRARAPPCLAMRRIKRLSVTKMARRPSDYSLQLEKDSPVEISEGCGAFSAN